jgi:hypothetical protein
MPPKKDRKGRSDQSQDEHQDTANAVGISNHDFKRALLDLLRHDEEVKACIAHIGLSRETDIFSGVVKCLKQGHDDVNEAIGMISILLFFISKLFSERRCRTFDEKTDQRRKLHLDCCKTSDLSNKKGQSSSFGSF